MKVLAVLLAVTPLWADVTADGGMARGPVTVRADGRMGFGPRGASVVDAKEGLERLALILDSLKRKKQLVEVNFERDADGALVGKVLEQIRSATPVIDVPSTDWLDHAIVLKTADFTLRFLVDAKDSLGTQANARAVMTDVQVRRRALVQANQQALKNGEDAGKFQEAMASMTNVYREVIQKVRLRR